MEKDETTVDDEHEQETVDETDTDTPDEGEDVEDRSLEEDTTDWKARAYKAERLLKKAQKPSAEPDKEAETPKGEYMTKKDYHRANEKSAIRLATTVKDTDASDLKAIKGEIEDNWDKVRAYYVPRNGKDTPEDIYEDILDAHQAWKRRQKPSSKGENKEVKANLAQDRGKGGSSPAKTDSPKKGVLKRAVPVSEWYA